MRLLTVFIAALALAAVALPVDAGHDPKRIHVAANGIPGDTWVMQMCPDHTGSGFRLLSGTVTVTGHYAPGFEDVGGFFGYTDLLTHVFGSFQYATGFGRDEVHVEVFTQDPSGVQVDLNAPAGTIDVRSMGWTITSPHSFNGHDDRYFAVSMPEASSIDVKVDLVFNKDVSLLATDIAASGRLVSAEDLDGLAQVTGTEATAALGMDASHAVAPGHEGFAAIFGLSNHDGVAVYNAVGPNGNSDQQIAWGRLGGAHDPASGAAIAVQGPGTYRLQVQAAAGQGVWDAPGTTGHAGMVVGAPMPLIGSCPWP